MGVGPRLNAGALAAVGQLVEKAHVLGVAIDRLPSGTAVIDCGVNTPGGYGAGVLFAEACLGGYGTVSLTPWYGGGLHLPGVQVVTDRPWAACMAAQYAGWSIRRDNFFAMGSGPARALAKTEAIYAGLPAVRAEELAVLALEGPALPADAVACYVAQQCGVDPANLTLLQAPTASLVGSVQVAARVVETALHKLHRLGFDITRVQSGWGTAPLAPVASDDLAAMGRTNDCILYGGRVFLTVDAADTELAQLAAALPANASADYGRPFREIFRAYDFDFYRVDPLLFSPAEVWLTGRGSGRTHHGGGVNPEILRVSLLGEGAEAEPLATRRNPSPGGAG